MPIPVVPADEGHLIWAEYDREIAFQKALRSVFKKMHKIDSDEIVNTKEPTSKSLRALGKAIKELKKAAVAISKDGKAEYMAKGFDEVLVDYFEFRNGMQDKQRLEPIGRGRWTAQSETLRRTEEELRKAAIVEIKGAVPRKKHKMEAHLEKIRSKDGTTKQRNAKPRTSIGMDDNEGITRSLTALEFLSID